MHNGQTDIITEIQSGISSINSDKALREETRFAERAEAIDFLEFHIIDRLEGLQQQPDAAEAFKALQQQAEMIRHELEQIDNALFAHLRKEIRTGASFAAMIDRYLGHIDSPEAAIGYDLLDTFINGLLSEEPLPEATLNRMPEMVFYQQTPARIIWELAERAKPRAGDVFFDLGSGLGLVTLLMHLLTGVASRGVEYEPAYCRYAAASAAGLGLQDVQFFNSDARNADYTGGTIFFLYTPFEGKMLEKMLMILEKEAQQRAIRIFTYGPCSSAVARQDWLHCLNGPAGDPYVLYEFHKV